MTVSCVCLTPTLDRVATTASTLFRLNRGYVAVTGPEAAGFLDEYVWTYLHRDAWGTVPPHEMSMGAFEEFRARELAGHEAQSGAHVRIGAVRVLPPPSRH